MTGNQTATHGTRLGTMSLFVLSAEALESRSLTYDTGNVAEAREVFPQVLLELKPNFILVCSKGVGADVLPVLSEFNSVCIDPASAYGWSYKEWVPVVRKALTAADALPRWPLDIDV
jgi:hypothetical protein